MKKTLLLLIVAITLTSCKDGKKKEESSNTEQITNIDTGKAYLEMTGIGPIDELDLEDINADLSVKGEKNFKTKCMACHMIDKKLIGPALQGVTQRRSPEWIMNMMLNPAEMVEKDPLAMAIKKENNNTVMVVPGGLTLDEATSILEYLRTL